MYHIELESVTVPLPPSLSVQQQGATSRTPLIPSSTQGNIEETFEELDARASCSCVNIGFLWFIPAVTLAGLFCISLLFALMGFFLFIPFKSYVITWAIILGWMVAVALAVSIQHPCLRGYCCRHMWKSVSRGECCCCQ